MHGERWVAIREAFEPHFTFRIVKDLRDIIESQVDDWSRNLCQTLGSQLKDQQSFQIEALEATKLLPFKIVSLVCFGELLKDGNNMHTLLSLVALHDQVFANATFNEFAKFYGYRYLPWTNANKDLTAYKTKWKSFCHHMVSSSKSQGYSSPAVETYSYVGSKISEEEWLQSISSQI